MKYRFIFSFDGEMEAVVRDVRPGMAEAAARMIAREIGKSRKVSPVICVWMGPAEREIPRELAKMMSA